MTKKAAKFGLIGYPLSHSFSPAYFRQKFQAMGLVDHRYDAYPIENIEDICSVVDNGLKGLNVTIPYKEQVIPFLDEMSEEAREIGAVNTIKIENGRLVGYNTDIYGFRKSLEDLLGGEKVENALVLGTGGASKAVYLGLQQMGIQPTYVSRNKPYMTYSDIDRSVVEDHRLIVNTTPLGMYPKTDSCPDLPYDFLTDKHFLYDLVYNPEKTLFLNNGTSKNCQTKNGYDMLILQAERSWEIWNQQ